MNGLMGSIHVLGDFAKCRYLTYPHANGFADGGRSLVVGQRGSETSLLWHVDLLSGRETKLGEWPQKLCGIEMLWFDIASRANVLITIVDNAVWKVDLNDPSPKPEVVYRETDGVLQALPSVTAGGTKVLMGRSYGGRYQAVEIDLTGASGSRVLFQSEWFANHFHYSPYDEAWVGFSHEGPADQVGDRVWGWHASVAPEGQCYFDNASAGLCVGHERWSFHETSAFAVAYGMSPQGPRGVYEVFPKTGSSRLVSEGDRDWHLNVSQDGRWIVVDTTGPYDAPGRGWENAVCISDVLVVDVESGLRKFVGRSCLAKGFHVHPHPVFSPDGMMIFFNEASADGLACRIVTAENPFAGTSRSRIAESVATV